MLSPVLPAPVQSTPAVPAQCLRHLPDPRLFMGDTGIDEWRNAVSTTRRMSSPRHVP